MQTSRKILLTSLIGLKALTSILTFSAEILFWIFGSYGMYLGFSSHFWILLFAYSEPAPWVMYFLVILLGLFFVGLIPFLILLFLRPAWVRHVSVLYQIYFLAETVILCFFSFHFLQIFGVCLNLAIIHFLHQARLHGKMIRYLEKSEKKCEDTRM